MPILNPDRAKNSFSGNPLLQLLKTGIKKRVRKRFLSRCRVYSVAISDIGCLRSNNEDNYILCKKTNQHFLDHSESSIYLPCSKSNVYLAGVFDGIGGGNIGEKAAKTAADSFRNSFECIADVTSKNHLDKLFVEVFSEANDQIVQLQQDYGFVGTTATVLSYYCGECKIYHLGDCRAYLFRDNDLFQLTTDHTLSNMKIKMGIYPSGYPQEEQDKHKLTHFLGKKSSSGNLNLETTEWIPVGPDDQILLCSDGLYNMCSDVEITRVIQTCGSTYDAASSLVALAKRNGGEDNITCVLIKFC